MSASAYERYVRLPELLLLQEPNTDEAEADIYRAEHFFIVVHQASELLLKQILFDLRAATAVPDHSTARLVGTVRRVTALLTTVRSHLNILEHLPKEDFLVFRDRLGDASGCQSGQFAELFDLLGLNDGPRQVASVFAPAGGTVQAAMVGGASGELADALAGLAAVVRDWQVDHIVLADRMVGHLQGTGGTTGVEYLLQRSGLKADDARLRDR